MFREMWSLMTAFVRDFFGAMFRGLRNNWKGFLIFCGVVAVVGLAGVFLLLEATASPKFCASCHNMQVYIESWQESTHRNVNCITCHFEPGFTNMLKGKWKAQMHVWMKLTGTAPPKPHTQVSDASCLQEGCHSSKALSEETIKFKGVRFSHGTHLGELRKGKKLRCVSCHSQIVQGEHLTVTETTCFTCHFNNRQEYAAMAECTVCHVETKAKIYINANENLPFVHREYLDRGVVCGQCHFDVITGDGHLKDNVCVQCHAEPDILLSDRSSESIHQSHVTDFKVECLRCHSVIEHSIVRPGTESASGNGGMDRRLVRNKLSDNHYDTDCIKCHSFDQHVDIRNMYMGSGAIDVPDMPSPMYLAHADCGSCHIAIRETATGTKAALRLSYEKVIQSCADCHGPGYDDMAKHWKKLLTEETRKAEKSLLSARQVVEANRKQAAANDAITLLDTASKNLTFVRNGRGLHNMDYALRVLADVMVRCEEAKARVKPSYAMREINPPTGCTQLCHSCVECIETKPVPFGGVQFPHDVHVTDEGMDCEECHTPREKHGQTLLKNCNECHHGEGMGAVECQDCHVENHNLYNGQNACDEISCDVRGESNPMADAVACDECHVQVVAGEETTLDGIKATCVECHDGDEAYADMVDDWIEEGNSLDIEELRVMLRETQGKILRAIAEGKYTYDAQDLVNNAEKNLKLFERGNPVHNLAFSKELTERIRNLLVEAQKKLKAYSTIKTLPKAIYY